MSPDFADVLWGQSWEPVLERPDVDKWGPTGLLPAHLLPVDPLSYLFLLPLEGGLTRHCSEWFP